MSENANSVRLKVLIACEESQAVCKEFRKLGHEAYSCDIKPCSGGAPEWHIIGDCIHLLDDPKWDLIIGHPPCTYLSDAGVRWLSTKGYKNCFPGWAEMFVNNRIKDRQNGFNFFMRFVNCKCKHVAIENPLGFPCREYRTPDQIIQPWQFGHSAQKATCLWLKGLPKLTPTNIVDKGKFYYWKDKYGKCRRQSWFHWEQKGSQLRSKTFVGIAKAMAEQWSKYILEEYEKERAS